MWPFSRGQDASAANSRHVTETGKVVRKSHSLQGGSAARTQIHLIVQTEAGLRCIQAGAGFTMLPLVEIGDTVSFTYSWNGPHISLEGFRIVWSTTQVYQFNADVTDRTERSATAVVLRKAESLQGDDAACSKIHLAVETHLNGARTGDVIVFQATAAFAYLPLVQVGDHVQFTYTVEKGHVQVVRFGIQEESLRSQH